MNLALTTPTPADVVQDWPTDLPSDLVEVMESTSLDDCRAAMATAFAEYQDNRDSAIRSAVSLGTAANVAKSMLPHGTFVDWVKANFPFSEQWCRACMRAANAWTLGHDDPEYAKLVAEADTVEKLAALLRPIEGKPAIVPKLRRDDDLVTDVEPKDAPTGAPATPAPAPAPEKALKLREKELDRKEKDLAAYEAKLNKTAAKLVERQAELDERERNLAMREAALKAPKPAADAKAVESIDELKAKKLANDALVNAKARRAAGAGVSPPAVKAPRKPTVSTQETPNAKVEGVGAGSPENGSKNEDGPF